MFIWLSKLWRPKYITIDDPVEIKTSELIEAMRARFPVYLKNASYRFLDREYPPPTETSHRQFLKRPEADRDLRSFCASRLRRMPTMTLRERLIFECVWLETTGRHPDAKTKTLCAGSPSKITGDIALVGWEYGRLSVTWVRATASDRQFAARQVFGPDRK